MKILSVVGTRPNFIKMAPLYRAFHNHPDIEPVLIHTGQHYDANLSDVFFDQLALPIPDYALTVAPGSITRQTAQILHDIEPILQTEQPDWLVVIGDVTSTLASALAAVRLGIPIAHVEAGLRSGDRQMPEELNRLLTDNLADALFVSEPAGVDNLIREGVCPENIYFVGNVLIDALVQYRSQAQTKQVAQQLGLSSKGYALLTMHRPATVDDANQLRQLICLIEQVSVHLPVVFPLHPRTRARLIDLNIMDTIMAIPSLHLLPPQGYLECLSLMADAAVVLTDSGGIQEETTYLNIPCVTLRSTTERPITLTLGTNQLLPHWTPEGVTQSIRQLLARSRPQGQIPPLWDGQAAHRIATLLYNTHHTYRK